MRKFLAVSVLALAASAGIAGAGPPGIPGTSGTLFVTERTPATSTLSAFDAADGTLLWTVPTGPAPIGVTKPRGSGKVYTSDENANRMSVFDARTGASLGVIPTGARPHHLMASRNGERIYVAEFGQNTVGVVDTSIDSVVGHFAASVNQAAKTHAVWISNDGRDLYAANGVANTISKLDASSGTLIWELPIGKNPSEILVTRDNKLAYVSVRDEDMVKVVDVSGEAPFVIGAVEAKGQPDTLSLTGDGKTLVVGVRSSPSGRARVGLIDTEALTTRYVEMPAHTTTGHQSLSANGKLTFIAVESPGAVAVIDNATAAVVGEYPYPGGGSRPHGVFYEPAVLP